MKEEGLKIEDYNKTLSMFIESLVPKLDKVMELEEKELLIANLKTSKCQLEGDIDDLFKIFKEGALRIAKKHYAPETFKHSLQKIPVSYQNEIIKIFQECGLKIPHS